MESQYNSIRRVPRNGMDHRDCRYIFKSRNLYEISQRQIGTIYKSPLQAFNPSVQIILKHFFKHFSQAENLKDFNLNTLVDADFDNSVLQSQKTAKLSQFILNNSDVA